MTIATIALTTTATLNYLVSEVLVPGVIPLSFKPDGVEALSGSFMVEKLANATTISHSDSDDLPFKASRYTCEGHVRVTFYGSDTAGYLVNDPPEDITLDELTEADAAYVRGERA